MARNNGKIVVTVHTDVVWKAAGIKLVRDIRSWHYIGNLDNVVCVAEVLRSVMPRVKDRNLKFYFTNKEETTMTGARSVMKREGKALYIAIDVTDKSISSDVNVEWMQNVNKEAVKKAIGRIKGKRIRFRTGEHDETLVYGKQHPTFSLNLPIKGHIHGISTVSFWKMRRFGRTVAEMLKRIRKNYDKICMLEDQYK